MPVLLPMSPVRSSRGLNRVCLSTLSLACQMLAALSLAGVPAQAHENHTPASSATDTSPQQQPWGVAAQAAQVRRTLTLTLDDRMRITPARITVQQGESVRLRVRNTGKLTHEVVLGTPAVLQAHAELMRQHPGMEHDEAHMVRVAPGKTGEILWTFTQGGTFEYGCLIDGHYQAGMKGVVQVQPRPGVSTAPANDPDHRAPHHTVHSADHHASSAPGSHPMPPMGGMQPPGSGAMAHHGAHHAAHHAAHHGAPAAAPATAVSPYAAGPAREIQALSAQELAGYAQGQGQRLALAAELNGYPGPLHVLELADALALSPSQRAQTEALRTQHLSQAQSLGAALIAAERALDRAFADRTITPESLQRLTQDAAQQLGALRAEHLQAHLAQTALLTPAQIARYNELRGYTRKPAAATTPPAVVPNPTHRAHP